MIQHSKIRKQLNNLTLNNQYSAAIQHAFGELIARQLLESLKKHDEDLFEKRSKSFTSIADVLSEKKVQRIGSNETTEHMPPEEMVLTLRRKALNASETKADINRDDLEQRLQHLFNDKTDEVAPIGIYHNQIEYGPRMDTVNRLGKIAARLLNVNI